MVFMSMVFHHFDDPARVAQECRRLLREDGVVCLRGASAEQIDAYPYVAFFPWRAIADDEVILRVWLPLKRRSQAPASSAHTTKSLQARWPRTGAHLPIRLLGAPIRFS